MKLKFTKDAFVNGELFAKAGDIKDIPEENGSAARWIRRGAIAFTGEEPKKEEPKKEEPKKEEPKKEEEVKAEEEDFLSIEKSVANKPSSGKNKGKKTTNKE